MQAHIYCRVSTTEQSRFSEGHVSLETQEDTCREYCHKNGIPVVSVDREVGSARNLDKLAVHRRLSRTIPAGDVLVVYNVSRFSRNLFQGLVVINKLKARGVKVHAVMEGCGYEGVAERHMFNTTLCFTEHQSSTLSENIRKNVAYRRRMGHTIGNAPYGMKAVRVGPNNIRKFIEEPAETNVIKYIKKLYQKGSSAKDIAQSLNTRKLCKRGAEWNAGRVKSVLLRYDHISMSGMSKSLTTIGSDDAGPA